ncbi:Putative cytochrome P450 136 [Halioglobus japonicus]|nr:Putative cytochrome P450 136 [Halioglobus japonicus]
MQVHELPRRPNPNLDHIPGDYGLPVIGRTFGLLYNSHKVGRHMLDTYGPVFRTSALFQRSVGLVGPDAARFVLLDGAQHFAAEPAWNRIIGGLFEGGLLLKDFSEHRSHRRALQQAFKRPVLEAYCSSLNHYLTAGLNTWPKDVCFDLFPQLKGLLLENAIQSFFGEDPDCDTQALSRAFIAMLDATLTLVRKPIPGGKWRRGMAGREVIKAYLKSQIQLRKANPGHDFLSSLCTAADEEGQLSDDEIIDHMIFLLFAAHDTTTSTLSSATRILCEHPQWQTRLRGEFGAVQGEQLSMDDFAALPELDGFFKEVLRMHPPVPGITRRTIEELEYGGYTLPANTSVFVSIRLMHYLSEHWTNPETFDPERFSAERAEHKRDSFQWLPFGGGAHKCLGLHFAEMQTKIFLFQLLRQFSVTLDPGHTPQIRAVPMEMPKNGLRIALTSV